MLASEIVSAHQLVAEIIGNIEKVVVGKRKAIELAVIAVISQGHLLIEDAPGVGKTILARSLAKSINCTFKRIQFTPDMLPGDITGVSVYNQKTNEFEFRPGPIVSQIVLADEINRATPKVQSALLEPMEERQVTVDGITYQMPVPFHVLATQDPIEYEGLFPLPEAQLDRFLLKISLGYPSVSEEIVIMERQQYIHPIEQLSPIADAADIVTLQERVKNIYVDDLVKQYIAAIVEATRHHHSIYLGASPRGSLALFRTAQARALVQGRDYVMPDDVKALAEPVLAHRLILPSTDGAQDRSARASIAEILEKVPVPGAIPGR
ncbi:MAG: MoxR family ATPase [Chloroflexi bacterium]|nr:MoxR family ATPase [Chloroflexota bacterium]MBI3040308.1 MoxR family ATPase [Chloroflexota bacterium]MBI3931387.1 MoxR family ATPase [Chloroflexota bacterium]